MIFFFSSFINDYEYILPAVESILSEIKGVGGVWVGVITDQEEKYLVGFVEMEKPKEREGAGEGGRGWEGKKGEEVRREMRTRVAEWMVPRKVVVVEGVFPLSSTGKIDKKALLEMYFSLPFPTTSIPSPISSLCPPSPPPLFPPNPSSFSGHHKRAFYSGFISSLFPF